jgi:hypothetical protein
MEAGATYRCDHGCGFRGSYEATAAHELSCALLPQLEPEPEQPQSQQPQPKQPQPQPEPEQPGTEQPEPTSPTREAAVFLREGMNDSTERLPRRELHRELGAEAWSGTCSLERKIRQVSAEVAELRSAVGGGTGLAYSCDLACGFHGSYEEVCEHETLCAMTPRETGCCSRGLSLAVEPELEPGQLEPPGTPPRQSEKWSEPGLSPQVLRDLAVEVDMIVCTSEAPRSLEPDTPVERVEPEPEPEFAEIVDAVAVGLSPLFSQQPASHERKLPGTPPPQHCTSQQLHFLQESM